MKKKSTLGRVQSRIKKATKGFNTGSHKSKKSRSMKTLFVPRLRDR